MSREMTNTLDALLKDVPTSRRQALKRLLAGTGASALALLLPTTTLLAQDPRQPCRPNQGPGDGSGKGRGKGDGSGRGQGKGEGSGQGRGRGQGKGRGRGKGTPPQ